MEVNHVRAGVPQGAPEIEGRVRGARREAEGAVGHAPRGHALSHAWQLVAPERPSDGLDLGAVHESQILHDPLLAAQTHVVDEVEDLHAGPRADAQSSTGKVQVSPTSEMTTRHCSGPAIASSRRIGSSSGSRLS